MEKQSHPILSEPTCTSLQRQERKKKKDICLLYFPKKVSNPEQLSARHSCMQPLPGCLFSPREPWLCALALCTVAGTILSSSLEPGLQIAAWAHAPYQGQAMGGSAFAFLSFCLSVCQRMLENWMCFCMRIYQSNKTKTNLMKLFNNCKDPPPSLV